jgi:leucyl aminopeptidase
LRTQKISGVIDFSFDSVKKDEILGALVGLGVASYRYLDAVKEKSLNRGWKFSVKGRPVEAALLHRAYALSSAMNLARHLANTPAADANPVSIAHVVKEVFRGHTGVKVDVLDVADLKKEKMGLLLGVGNGSATGARLVHVRYRPASARNKKPLALVGKGVTFDTGGLDIKGSSNMRLMKKDMSGAAAMAGLAHFVSLEKLKVACDFYLPLAENAVSDRATRPGDVHRSRAGHLVEIDNTDAEGRLVMADAFDYALSQTGAHAPEALFDVATLTGAMRVAVGLDVSGYFSNNDNLAKHIDAAATDAGEMAWRMPLVRKYNRQLNSSFADFKNSTESGFGGAITAALFLEKFVKDIPWVHFDVMSWNNSGDGAFSDGANAQCMQILAYYLMKRG